MAYGQQRSIKNSTTDVEEEHSASKNMNSFTETLLPNANTFAGMILYVRDKMVEVI